MSHSTELLLRLDRARIAAILAIACCAARGAYADTTANCDAFTTLDSKASSRLGDTSQPLKESGCSTQVKIGYPVPDPHCTPGAINTTLTVDILRDPAFRTTCVRDNATTRRRRAHTVRTTFRIRRTTAGSCRRANWITWYRSSSGAPTLSITSGRSAGQRPLYFGSDTSSRRTWSRTISPNKCATAL